MNFLNLIEELKLLGKGIQGKNIALIGTLGAGKTHLVSQMAEPIFKMSLDEVSSPTFTIINNYQTKTQKIAHIDLYRVEEAAELLEIGIYEVLDDDKMLVLVEWADLFDEILEMCHYRVDILILNSGKRDYKLQKLD